MKLKYKGLALSKNRYNFSTRNEAQKELADAIYNHDMVLAIGCAGTGKTHASVAAALSYFRAKRIHKIVIARPSVGAGEANGYLPGTLQEKLAPFMRPIYDVLDKLTLGTGNSVPIELCTFEHMRGRSFDDSFVIVDEIQNATLGQLEMATTRLGQESKMILTGDPSQSDLPPGRSGLSSFMEIVAGIPDIAVVRFTESHNLRHPLVAQLTNSFSRFSATLNKANITCKINPASTTTAYELRTDLGFVPSVNNGSTHKDSQ